MALSDTPEKMRAEVARHLVQARRHARIAQLHQASAETIAELLALKEAGNGDAEHGGG